MTATTVDALGPLWIEQPARGYRVNEDALILADFCGFARGAVFDLGAGVGAIGLTLAVRFPSSAVVLVEREEGYARLAEGNARRNALENVEVVHADAQALAKRRGGQASLVVCNPPFVREGRGRAPAADKRGARMGDVATFVSATRALLGKRGRACYVYPANDFVQLCAEFRGAGLEPKRARWVHATASSPARVVLVEVVAGKRGGLVVEAPLFSRAGDRG